MSEYIATSRITLDGGTQSRAEIDNNVVTDYAADMKIGKKFPAIIVFHDGENYWLADGFHRVHAARRANVAKIAADVRQGTQRDAILYSVGANADHGLRRTNDDKRRAVQKLLSDDEWTQWSNVKIAECCSVSESLVRSMRPHFASNEVTGQPSAQRTYTTKHGTQATMNTGKIGKASLATDASETNGKAVRYEQDADADAETPEDFTKISFVRRGVAHGEYNFTDDGDPIIYEDSFYAVNYITKRVVVVPFASKDEVWRKYNGLQAVSGISFLSSPMLQKCEFFPPDVYAERVAVDTPYTTVSVMGGVPATGIPLPARQQEEAETAQLQALFVEPPAEDGDTPPYPAPAVDPAQEPLPFQGDEPSDPDYPFGYEVTPFGRKALPAPTLAPEATVSAATQHVFDTAASLRDIAAKLSNTGTDTPLSGWEERRLQDTKPIPPKVQPVPPPKPVITASTLPSYLVSAAKTVLTGVDCDDPTMPLHGRVLVGLGGEHTPSTMLKLQHLSGALLTGLSSGRIQQAILIAPAWTSDVWFGNLWGHSICFCRQPFKLPTASGEMAAEEAIAVTYFGYNVLGFVEEFDAHGPVVFSTRMLRRFEVDPADFFAEPEEAR